MKSGGSSSLLLTDSSSEARTHTYQNKSRHTASEKTSPIARIYYQSGNYAAHCSSKHVAALLAQKFKVHRRPELCRVCRTQSILAEHEAPLQFGFISVHILVSVSSRMDPLTESVRSSDPHPAGPLNVSVGSAGQWYVTPAEGPAEQRVALALSCEARYERLTSCFTSVETLTRSSLHADTHTFLLPVQLRPRLDAPPTDCLIVDKFSNWTS